MRAGGLRPSMCSGQGTHSTQNDGRAHALFELADAVLCADGPIRSLVGEHRRGHGGLYDALAAGQVDVGRLRRALAAVSLQPTPCMALLPRWG
jgi:hypothetical protein